jgi:hypothetical protein
MLAAQVMENHLHAVTVAAKGIGVVVTDTERFAMQGDRIVARSDLLKAVRLPVAPRVQLNEEWDWMIAPAPEEHPSQDIVHVVSARIYERQVPEEKAAAAPAASDEPLHELPVEDGLTDIGATQTNPG